MKKCRSHTNAGRLATTWKIASALGYLFGMWFIIPQDAAPMPVKNTVAMWVLVILCVTSTICAAAHTVQLKYDSSQCQSCHPETRTQRDVG